MLRLEFLDFQLVALFHLTLDDADRVPFDSETFAAEQIQFTVESVVYADWRVSLVHKVYILWTVRVGYTTVLALDCHFAVIVHFRNKGVRQHRHP